MLRVVWLLSRSDKEHKSKKNNLFQIWSSCHPHINNEGTSFLLENSGIYLIYVLPCSLLKLVEQCPSWGTHVTSTFPTMFSWMCGWVSGDRQLNTFRRSSCETAMWRFGSGVYISCTVFVSFSSGHSEIVASLATHVQPSHSLPPVSQHIP